MVIPQWSPSTFACPLSATAAVFGQQIKYGIILTDMLLHIMNTTEIPVAMKSPP